MKSLIYLCIVFFAFQACTSQPPLQDNPQDKFAAELQQAEKAARQSLLKNQFDFSSLSDLHYAAGWGSVELAQHILQKDKKIDVRDSADRTPLILAAGFNNPAMVSFLLSQGAELEAHNFSGSRAIHLASGYNSDIKVLEMLLDAGSDINRPNDMQSTPLHWAAAIAALPQTRLLLERGAQVQARDWKGYTPLALAQRSTAPQDQEIIDYLQGGRALQPQ